MTVDFKKLNLMFQKRKTQLRPPSASDSNLADIENKLAVKIGADFKHIYERIDGFVNYDYPSQLRLWSLEEIAGSKQASDYLSRHPGWAVIGDFLLDSDLIVIAISEKDALVKMAFDGKTLAPNLGKFLYDMAEGKFDFLS